MQQLQQRPLTVSRRHALDVRSIVFPIVSVVACIIAFPSFLIGLVIWWRSTVTWDPREFWRITWAASIVGLVIYGTWVILADPLPWLLSGAYYDLVHHLWEQEEQAIGLLWLFNIFLAPILAPALAFLYPVRKQLAPVKQPSLGSYEREEDVMVTTALAQFESMLATIPSTAALERSSAFAAANTAQPIIVNANPAHYEALGTFQGGELASYVFDGEFCIPPEWLEVHGTLVGEPKHGKTTTLIRLAAIARMYGRKPIYIDLKGSKRTAALFLAVMSAVGVKSVKMFPLEAYDGFRGDAKALYNKLMQQIDPITHPFYRSGIGSAIVSLAVEAPCGPPRNSYQFLERLDLDWLKAQYAADAQAMREINYVASHIAGLGLVFAGFFRGVRGGLDGAWAFEDGEAAYIGIDGIAHREEAAILGRYLLDDAAQFATLRKATDDQVLLIVDEFGVLESTNATNLYESVREAGMSIYAAAQSYQGLGAERDSVLAASAVKILHRCGNPEPLVKYAGERDQYSFSRVIGGQADDEEILRPLANRPADDQNGFHTVMRPERRYTVPIEDVQQLELGQIAYIMGGKGAFLQVYPLAIPQAILQAAAQFIRSAPKFQPLPPPTLPPPQQQKPKSKKQKATNVVPNKGASPGAGARTPAAPKPAPQSTKSQTPPPSSATTTNPTQGAPAQNEDDDDDLKFFN